MLAVPPLIPLIHRELHLDEKAVGALVSLPVLLLAAAAVPGALLIAKLGVRGALAVGLGCVAVFGGLRGFGPSTPVLFTATFLMGVGVAVSQPAFPSLVREWFPRRIAVAAPRRGLRPAVAARWWPNWREGPAVRIGLVMGMASAVYFGTNAYVPDFLDQTGRRSLITPTLFFLNGGQLLTAPVVALREKLLTGRAGFLGSATLMAIGQLGLVLTPGAGVVVWAFLVGFAAALAFIVALTLPPRLAAAGDVARMSAAVFTVQYGTAFVLPLIAGALWDLTGVAALAFAPGVAAAAVMAWLALSLRLGGTQGKIPAL